MSSLGENVQRKKKKRLRTKPLGIIIFKDQIEEGNPATLLRRSNGRRRRKTRRMFHQRQVRKEAGVHRLKRC